MQTIVHEPADFGNMMAMPGKVAINNASESDIGINLELQGDGQGHTSLTVNTRSSVAVKKARLASAKPTVASQFGARAGALAEHRKRRLMSARPNNSKITKVQSRNQMEKAQENFLRTKQPETLIQGDELMIQKPKFFDVSETISRQDRIEAHTVRTSQKTAKPGHSLKPTESFPVQIHAAPPKPQTLPIRQTVVNRTNQGSQSFNMSTDEVSKNMSPLKPAPFLNNESMMDSPKNVGEQRRDSSDKSAKSPKFNMAQAENGDSIGEENKENSNTNNVAAFDKMADQAQDSQDDRAGPGPQNQEVLVAQKNEEVDSRSPVGNGSINFVIASSGTDGSRHQDQIMPPILQPAQAIQVHKTPNVDQNNNQMIYEQVSKTFGHQTQSPQRSLGPTVLTLYDAVNAGQRSRSGKNSQHEPSQQEQRQQIRLGSGEGETAEALHQQLLSLNSLPSPDELTPLATAIASQPSNQNLTTMPQFFKIPKISSSEQSEQQEGVLMSKSRLAKLRQEEHRKRVSLSRDTSSHTVLHPEGGEHSCIRCLVREDASTKFRVDQGHRDTGQGKMYFKPSVVEVHDETAPVQSQSPQFHKKHRPQSRDSKDNIEQSYLLGPHVSQENPFLLTIREESIQNQRASLDSQTMAALFGTADDVPNVDPLDLNPETREFIQYLSKVQPDLLLSQTQQSLPSSATLPLSPATANSLDSGKERKDRLLSALRIQQDTFGQLVDDAKRINFKNNLTSTVEEQELEQSSGLVSKNSPPESMIPTPNLQQMIIREEESAEVAGGRQAISVGDAIQTDRNKAFSTSRTQKVASQETLTPCATTDIEHQCVDVEESEVMPQQTQIHLSPEPVIQTNLQQEEGVVNWQNEDVRTICREPTPVDYTGQMTMIQDIFKQIANQRDYANRTTVRNQKLIFQPAMSQYRRLDFKPLTTDPGRQPQYTKNGLTPVARPPPQPPRKLWRSRRRANTGARTVRSPRDSPDEESENQQTLKLEKSQVGTRGQFASLLQGKRAKKMVTWDIEPPPKTSSYGASQYSHISHSYGQTETDNSYYDEQQNAQHPAYQQQEQRSHLFFRQQFHGENYLQPRYEGDGGALQQEPPMQSAEDAKTDQEQYAELTREERRVIRGLHRIPENQRTRDQALLLQRMSPIREVSSISQDGNTTVQEEDSKADRTEEHKSEHPSQGVTAALSIRSSNATEEGKAPHRHGVPCGAETSSLNMSGYDGAVQGAEKSAATDDTFADLFRNKEEAAAFKAGLLPGQFGGIHKREQSSGNPETVEWSQESLGYPLKKDEDGNVLTHRGNPIVRGFNPAQQRHRRIVSTKDKAILKAENIKHYFDDIGTTDQIQL